MTDQLYVVTEMDLRGQKIIYRVHALKRMFERRITVVDVRQTIQSGAVVEEYPNDKPYPSRLLLGFVSHRPIHIVIAENSAASEIFVVTVYEPDPLQWDQDFKVRLK